MHIMYLTPEEQRVAIYEAVKTNDMSSLNPEAVRTYHIKDSWFKSPGICHRSSPAASIRRKTVGLFSCLPEKDGMAISQASLPDDFREVCELCMGYKRDGGKLMLTDISGKELSDAYMFRYKSGDGLAHPLLFYPVSVTWTLKEIIVAGVLGFGDVIQTGTVRISKEDGKAWFRMRGNGMRCTLNPLNSEKWVCFCKTLGAMRREQ